MQTKTKQWTDGSSATIQYDGQGDGHITITSDPNNHYEARSMQITVETTDGSGIQRVVTVNQAAKQRIDLSAAVVTAATQTFSGSAKTPTPTVTLNGSTVPSSGYDVSYSNNTNAGTATITITGKGDYTGVAYGTFTINKASGYAGVSSRSLTYSRSAQSLVTTNGNTGTVHYRLGTSGSWSTSIPTSTNAGTYTIYYYVDASTNYNAVGSSSSPYSVSTTIAKRTPVLSTSPTARTGLSYTGSAQNLLSGGAMKHSSSNSTSVGGTFTYAKGTNAGTYSSLTWSFAPTDTTNYNSTSGSISGSVTIAKATPSYTAPTANNRPYNTSSAALLIAGSNTTPGSFTYSSSQSGTYSSTIPSQTNAGTYTTWWKFTPTDTTNYETVNTSISTTISKASRTLSFADTYMVLNTSSSGTKTATPSAGSSDGAITYSLANTTYATINSSTGKVTSKTSDGSVTVTATIAAGTNYLSATATYTLYVFATTHNYDYNGSYRSVTLPPGTYQFQVWGAQGGSNGEDSTYGITAQNGGKGGYSVGQLTISQAKDIRVYVGGQGSATAAGYNGGGSTVGSSILEDSNYLRVSRMGGGGGASDIRLSDGSLYSRMIVAGGGSGGAMCYRKKIIDNTETTLIQVGYVGGGTNGAGYPSYYGTQTAAGYYASFGKGANQTNNATGFAGGAGGGGWYGGGSSGYYGSNMEGVKLSGGGSGFVNTAASAGNRPSGYTGLELDSGTTYAGNTSFPAPGGGNETGHSGNGYVRITRIS